MRLLLSVSAICFLTLIACGDAFGCGGPGCPTAYCVAVSCSAGSCFGQISVCTCTGQVSCASKCHSFGPIYCCNDRYALYDDDYELGCPHPGCPPPGSPGLPAGESSRSITSVGQIYLTNCDGGYALYLGTSSPPAEKGRGK
jgi:hypothetical protein